MHFCNFISNQYAKFVNFHIYIQGASSVMVARGALWNASIFSSHGKLPWEEVKKEYVRKVNVAYR